MNNTLGTHVLIDFYNCKAAFTTPDDFRPLVERAFEFVGVVPDSLDVYQKADEITCIALAGYTHVCIHAYPTLAYTAVDIYSFNTDVQASKVMSALKLNLKSDRIKATSIRRGDFGSIRDMKPKRKKKITTIRRMKNTGVSLKETSERMLYMLRHPGRTKSSHRNKKKK